MKIGSFHLLSSWSWLRQCSGHCSLLLLLLRDPQSGLEEGSFPFPPLHTKCVSACKWLHADPGSPSPPYQLGSWWVIFCNMLDFAPTSSPSTHMVPEWVFNSTALAIALQRCVCSSCVPSLRWRWILGLFLWSSTHWKAWSFITFCGPFKWSSRTLTSKKEGSEYKQVNVWHLQPPSYCFSPVIRVSHVWGVLYLCSKSLLVSKRLL